MAEVAVTLEDLEECPHCGGPADLEEDGEHRYHVCQDDECGNVFGYHSAPVTQAEGTCALGVPEAVRLATSMEEPAAGVPVAMGPTRRSS